MLLFIGTARRICSDIVNSANDAIVNDVWLARVLVGRLYNNSIAGIVCFDSSLPSNSVNLALNFQLDALETCHCVHVDANLPIYEVDVLLNYVVETLNHWRCCFPLRLYRTERQAEPVYLHMQSFNHRAS
jgi:hypothetical protein